MPGKIMRKFVPERLELVLGLEPRSLADPDRRDHARDADDDAERRQERAQLVARERAKRDLQDVAGLRHGAAPLRAAGGAAARRFVTGTSRQDLPVAERDDAPGVLGDVRLVRDEDDRLPLVVQLLEDRHDLLGGLRVEVSRRLVGEEDRRIVHEAPRDRDALLLAARELRRRVVPAVREADALEARSSPCSRASSSVIFDFFE